MAASKLMIVFVVMAIASFRLPSSVAQSNRYVVGDNTGWRIPDESTFYVNWASGKNFTVGDTLVFNFANNNHDVTEVRESAFGPCTTTDFITRNTTGPVTTTLTTPGNHYYICTIGTHCQDGQKLSISVAEATGSTPPNSTTPSPTNGTMSPPPSSPSSSSSFTAIVPVTFLAAALAFFY